MDELRDIIKTVTKIRKIKYVQQYINYGFSATRSWLVPTTLCFVLWIINCWKPLKKFFLFKLKINFIQIRNSI